MQVAVDAAEGPAHVVRDVEAGALAIDAVAIVGVGADLHERAHRLIRAVVDVLPRVATVGGEIDAALARIELTADRVRFASGRRTISGLAGRAGVHCAADLEVRVHDLRIHGRDGNTDASFVLRRDAVRQLFPRFAAVDRLAETAARPPLLGRVVEVVAVALPLVGGDD